MKRQAQYKLAVVTFLFVALLGLLLVVEFLGGKISQLPIANTNNKRFKFLVIASQRAQHLEHALNCPLEGVRLEIGQLERKKETKPKPVRIELISTRS